MCGHGIVLQEYCTFFVFGHWVSWLNASQRILTTHRRRGNWKNKNLGKLRPSGQLNSCRMGIVIWFWATISSQASRWSQLSPSGNGAHTALPPHIGVVRHGGWNVRLRRLQRPRLGRQPRPQCQRCPCGGARRGTRLFAEAIISMTCTSTTARHREGGICWRCLWKNSSAIAWQVWWGQMILKRFEWISWRH